MTTKAKGNLVRQKITDLSKKLNVPFQNVQTAFMIERLVAQLVADKTLSQNLVFKGGFVGLRVYNSERYTVDLILQLKVNMAGSAKFIVQVLVKFLKISTKHRSLILI